MGLPDPPSLVEIHRDVTNPSNLVVHFTLNADLNDRGSRVYSFLVMWSDTMDFSQNDRNSTISVNSTIDDRLPKYKVHNNGVNPWNVLFCAHCWNQLSWCWF